MYVQALEDFEMAAEAGFGDLPYLLMQMGTVMRLLGQSKRAVETFNRAMEALNNTLSDDVSESGTCLGIYVYRHMYNECTLFPLGVVLCPHRMT